jgi:hypothetical protein
MVEATFVVYLAEDRTLQWWTTGQHTWAPDVSKVLSRIARLHANIAFITEVEAHTDFERQLAEALARCLSDRSCDAAMEALDGVEKDIEARNRETAWLWYFGAAYKLSLACLVLAFLAWIFRDGVVAVLGHRAFQLLLGVMCGALGALLFATSRGNRLDLDAKAGKTLHQLEGLSRVGAGMIGAALAALAIESGVIFGGTHFAGSRLALTLAVCIVAGASERLVPDLIRRFEGAANRAGDHAGAVPSAHADTKTQRRTSRR